jgi:hypothetical protein|tara:strand:- start:2551 stop:2787 length:237 start_codon:yes stop_codon:yes gene_type:complete
MVKPLTWSLLGKEICWGDFAIGCLEDESQVLLRGKSLPLDPSVDQPGWIGGVRNLQFFRQFSKGFDVLQYFPFLECHI